MAGHLKEVLEECDTVATIEALSQTAEAAERYQDMVEIMKKLVKKMLSSNEGLTGDQRNLLSVAYKNVVGVKRSSTRMLTGVLTDEQFPGIDKALIEMYTEVVTNELKDICNEVLEQLEALQKQNEKRFNADPDRGVLEKQKEYAECQVFYLKMIGDYYRYLTEAFNEDKYKENCEKYYQDAMALAKEHLEATHPTRLGLALNFSVCHFEILERPTTARRLAKEAFDEAIEKLDSLNDMSYKDSTLIMQLLRDNLTIWTAEQDAPKENAEAET